VASSADDLSSVSISLLPYQRIDQINGVEEAHLLSLIDQCGSQGNGDVGFACSGSAHQNEIVGILGELARTKRVRSAPA